MDPRTLIRARNDKVARAFRDPTNEERRRWVEAQLERPEIPADLTVRTFADKDRSSFLCAEHAQNPPLEDWITGNEQADGSWSWTVRLE